MQFQNIDNCEGAVVMRLVESEPVSVSNHIVLVLGGVMGSALRRSADLGGHKEPGPFAKSSVFLDLGTTIFCPPPSTQDA